MGGGGQKKQKEVRYVDPYSTPEYIASRDSALAAQKSSQDALDEEERKKKNRRGRSSTLLTEDQGGVSNVGQKTLLGS